MSSRERGGVTVLTLGFLIVLGLLTVVVVNASAAFLQRRELMSLADRVALHASDGLDRQSVYGGGFAGQARLADRETRLLADSLLPDDVTARILTRGDRVDVRLERRTRLPLVPPGLPNAVTVRAEATGWLRLAP